MTRVNKAKISRKTCYSPRFCVAESFQKFASMYKLMLTILFAIRDTGYHIEKFKSVHIVWEQLNLNSSKSCESRFRTDVDTLLLQMAFATFFIFYILQAKYRRSNIKNSSTSQFYLFRKHFLRRKENMRYFSV